MKQWIIASLLLLGAACSAQGQTEHSEPATAPDTPEATPATETPGDQPDDEAAKTEEAPGSPFDYNPSEEISEDLSVSFPVDI